jgi:transcriptional regulator with XRE-family HTH domain
MDVGDTLRRAREQAGYSLADLAARTRIPVKFLHDIEENDFSKLPSGIFARSFIRTFAAEVGVDALEAVADYRAMTEPPPIEAAAEPPESAKRSSSRLMRALTEPGFTWSNGLIVATLFVAVLVLNRDASKHTSPPVEPAQRADSAADDTTRPAPAGAVATNGSAMQFDISAQGPCWVRAVVDGEPVFARILQPGERQTLIAQRDVVIRVGDPAAFSYSINGKPGPILGTAGTPVTVRFAANGRTSTAS